MVLAALPFLMWARHAIRESPVTKILGVDDLKSESIDV